MYATATMPREDSPARLFMAGMAVTLGNPKIMMFYLALLPTIIDLGIGVAGRLGRADADHGRRADRHRPRPGCSPPARRAGC